MSTPRSVAFLQGLTVFAVLGVPWQIRFRTVERVT
jgi:hypothetical protein